MYAIHVLMQTVLSGDIKYKDVNGDGVVDDYDIVPLQYSGVPQIQSGFAAEFNRKIWNVSALFEGVSRVMCFSGGSGFGAPALVCDQSALQWQLTGIRALVYYKS